MPHIPDFPTPSDDVDEDGREPERGGIIDRIIDGNFPTGTDPRRGATPSR